MPWLFNSIAALYQKMKRISSLLALLVVSNMASANPYLILSIQAATGQNNLEHSHSLLTNIGLGLESPSGFYLDWALGLSGETIAEIILDDDFEHDENKQRGQMDLLAGYQFNVTERTFMKIGVGLETAIFDKDCAYNVLEGRTICARKYEHGPTYKIAYYFKSRTGVSLGLEYNRDELSALRKYNGLAVVVNFKGGD